MVAGLRGRKERRVSFMPYSAHHLLGRRALRISSERRKDRRPGPYLLLAIRCGGTEGGLGLVPLANSRKPSLRQRGLSGLCPPLRLVDRKQARRFPEAVS